MLYLYVLIANNILDYAIPVFYHSLPQYLQNDLKRLEKRAMAIIMPTESYSNTLNILGIPSLKDHHEQLCAKLFQSVVSDINHKIHNLLPDRNQPSYNLRQERTFNIPMIHTNRVKNSFIYAMCNKHNLS